MMFLDRTLLTAARAMLRVVPPAQALAWLRRAGGMFPPLRSRRELAAVARAFGARGTCLSRSLAIAARAPEAQVAIGVSPGLGAGAFAHAWIELNGEPIDPVDPSGEVIVRIPRESTLTKRIQ
jgi:hypothetical protein